MGLVVVLAVAVVVGAECGAVDVVVVRQMTIVVIVVVRFWLIGG